MSIKAWVYFGVDANMLEHTVQDLIDRGGRIISASIAYGPSPAKVARMVHADTEDSWHVLVVVDTEELRDE